MNQLKTKRVLSVTLITISVLLMLLSSSLWADATSKYQWEVLQEQKKAEQEGREPKKIKRETKSQRQWRLKQEQKKKKSVKER